MKTLFAVFLVILFPWFAEDVQTIEIHAPWSPGESWDCDRITSQFHSGIHDNCIDFNKIGGTDEGAPILSVSDGRVVTAEWSNTYGWYIWIEESDLSQNIYAHLLQEPIVKQGEYVRQGQVIGFCGCTPDGPGGTYCTGYHLHFGHYVNGESQLITRIDGQDIDPDGFTQVTSHNTNLFDLAYNRFGADLIGQREYIMWDVATAEVANVNHPWFYRWDHTNLYRDQDVPNNCVIQHLDGGFYWDGAIVYDALGGARNAYVLHSGFWVYWTTNNTSPCDENHPELCTDDGPQSALGMPITDEYSLGTNKARQDFQLEYLLYEQGASPEITIHPYTAPGWTATGWNPKYSYLFTDAYDRNGAARDVGDATETVVVGWNGTAYAVQHFGDDRMIVYDPDNYVGNPAATNEAYYIFGDFYLAFTKGRLADGTTLPCVLGAPTRDREGNVQFFKFGRMEDHDGIVLAYNADGQEIWQGVMEIAGSRIGTLYAHNSPYKVIGQLSVPAGQTLTIEPGCEFIFQGHYKFIVSADATLLAVGRDTETDSIRFTAADKTNGWHGIRFLNASSNSRLKYCVIEYGNANSSTGWDDWGGGVFCYYSDPTISNCLIRFNKALVGLTGGGGGIAIAHSSPVVFQCTITENQATRRGGGGILSFASSVTATGNEISNNTSFFRGGGMLVEYGSATVSDNKFISNTTSSEGGGFWSWLANVTISQNTFEQNQAQIGGGVYVAGGSVQITNNLISNNRSVNSGNSAGAGMSLTGNVSGVVSGNIISNNTVNGGGAVVGGGGIYCTANQIEITGNYIYGNNGQYDGGGIYVNDGSKAYIHNNSIYNNTARYLSGGIEIRNANPIIRFNSIYGNNGGMFNATPSYATINATNNWWGDASGPYNANSNPSGTGNSVSDFVNYGNWLSYSPDVQGLIDQAVAQLSGGFSQKIAEPGHISTDVSSTVQLLIEVVSEAWQIILNWPGSELNLKVYQPDGTLFGEWQSTVPPIIAEMIPANTGTWSFEVTAIDIPNDNYPFALVVGSLPLGLVSGIVADSSGNGFEGVTVDLYSQANVLLSYYVTDNLGQFSFPNLIPEPYDVTLISPLGYIADAESKSVTVVSSEDSVINFTLTALEIIPSQRSMGFWKHQVNVHLSGKGNAQVSLADLSTNMDLIRGHFNSNLTNPVTIFDVPQLADQTDSLGTLKTLLTVNRDGTMNERAGQQLTALLLNVVSGKLSQADTSFSEDDLTVSQAITYCNTLITDSEPENDERAKDIAELINNGQVVPAGWIDLATPNIAYKQTGDEQLPTEFSLSQNYPNPFNPQTTISYSLPQPAHVKIEIYNILGQKVRTLVNYDQEAGEKTVVWNGNSDRGSSVSSGIYFYKIVAGDFVMSKKMVLLK